MLPENRRRARPRSVVRPASKSGAIRPGCRCATKANEPIRIAVSRSHNTDETFEHIARIKAVHPAAEIVEQGSSFKFCLLAEGTVEIYVRTSNTYEWDTAAGEIILSEGGGGRRTVRRGRRGLQYNKISLHNPHFVCRSKYFR